MLREEEIQTYRKVGKLVSEIRERARSKVKPGVTLLSIAEYVEDLIRDMGAKPAFPCNVSLNQIAAHYTPPASDETRIEEGDLVKIDIGAQIDGYIADTATTVATGKNIEMVETIEHILEEAIKVVRPGIGVGEIGEVVEKTARASGFKPIQNLTGHSLARWALHAGISIPNIKEEPGEKIKAGDVLALEPFITDGAGVVEDQPQAYIFSCLGDRPVRTRMARKLLMDIRRLYGTLPFAERWLAKRVSRIRLELSLRDLISSGAIHPYHVLKERENGKVAQAEHTVIVTEDGCEVTTR